MERAQVADRLSHENLRHDLSALLWCGKDLGQREFLVGREEPILDKDLLKLEHGRPVQSQMRVAPGAKLRILAEILVADVHAAREADPSIDDQDFAMTPQVDRPAMQEGASGQE